MLKKRQMGKKIYHVDLTKAEQDYLLDIVKRRKSESGSVKRSQILLAADRNGEKNWSDKVISESYLVNVRTVERLREKFVLHGLEIALKGLRRLNEDKIKFDGVVETKLVTLRCSTPPEGYSSWTLTLLADRMVKLEIVESISSETVRRILKKRNQALASQRVGHTSSKC